MSEHGDEAPKPSGFQPYIPASQSLPEITVKAIILGLILSAVLAGANAYLGLKVDETAQCSTPNGKIRNLWAAGETMAGSILGQGYLAGFGMTIGTVFGKLAGESAAEVASVG